MTPSLTADQTRLLRLRAQGLYRPPSEAAHDVAQIVGEAAGLQAQDAAAGRWAAGVRGPGLTVGDVEHARVVARTVVRTWAMRGTLHLVAATDLRGLRALCGPLLLRGDARRRTQLGLDDPTCARAMRLIREAIVADGPRTRADLAARLGAVGIPTAGQAIVHLLYYAVLSGLICQGPDRDGEPAYVLLDDWVAPAPVPPRPQALAALARRYLAAYGPAGPDDLAAWAGLPKPDVRLAWAGIADEVRAVEADGQPAWLLKERAGWLDGPPPAQPIVHLLPAFDTYLLGYRDRRLSVAPEHARHIHPGGGILHPTLLVDGRAQGVWRSARKRDRLEVVVAPFADLPAPVQAGLEAAAAALGHFLSLPVDLRVARRP
jgi:winged helix DNA-binding protein